MIRFILLLCTTIGVSVVGYQFADAQQTLRPEDPIASVDGQPIFLGELNLVLVDRLKIRDVSKATDQVRQAIAATLVRQHLAMKSLRSQGGASLQQMIDRHISELERELKRRGSSLQQHAKLRSSTEASYRESLAWEAAWRGYLKSRMTDENLQTYFQRNQQKYGGGRWDVSQLYLKVDTADQATAQAVKERLEKLVQEIRQSDSPEAKFTDAARTHSEGGSASNGGRVGWVQADGDLPASVMNAVRSTKAGDVSDVVVSPMGLHVVLVHEFQKSDVGFDDLTDQAQLRRDATDALFHQLVRQQKDAKVSWYIPALKPPAEVSLIPE
ncbi:MAG: peptidylprolyl isomerase [Pirellulaceae bacterium]